MKIAPGVVIDGSLRVERFLAEGAFGEVFEGIHLKSRRRVAIKFLRAELRRDREWAERFRREAEAASKIRSPHVARILGAGDSKNAKRPWIAFELLEGESLDKRLQRGPIAFPDAATLIEQMLRGLSAAHDAGVIHRDVKPSNLFIEAATARLRVLDFGIAKFATPETGMSSLTRMDVALGTPIYMSPEQLHDSANVDKRTDVYAAGCVAFHVLAGSSPFKSADMMVLLSQKQSPKQPSLARASGVTWPEMVESWIEHAMARAPDDRFIDAPAALAAWQNAVARSAGFEAEPVERRDDDEGGEDDTDIVPPSFA